MNWIEKVHYLKMRQEQKDYDKDKFHIDLSVEKTNWQPGELEEIIKDYPYVSREYVGFIREFDNLVWSFCTFFGSKKGNVIPLAAEIAALSEYTNRFKYDYFPFGKDPAGSIFAFNKKQGVVCFDIDDYEFQNPEKIAENFEKFAGDCLAGKKIKEFLSDTSGYYLFLKHLDWI